MAAKKRQMSLGEFITGQTCNGTIRERYGPLKELRLVHVNANKQADGDVGTWPVPEDLSETMIDSLAQTIQEAAATDAQTLRNAQTYAVMAMFEVDGDLRSTSRFLLVLAGSVDPEGAGYDTEPANPQGLVAQAQRHVEGIWRLANQSQVQAFQTLTLQIDRMSEMLGRAMEREVELGKLVGELTMKKAEATAALQEQQFRIDMKRKAGEKVIGALPGVINRLTGVKLLDDGNPLARMLVEWGGSLTQEQFDKMIETLDENQRVQAVMLFQEIMRHKEKIAQEQKEEKRPVEQQEAS